MNGGKDLSEYSMLELFRMEVEHQSLQLEEGLQQMTTQGAGAVDLETMMRAAHSIKGAARMVGVRLATRIAHAMEDLLVAAQRGETRLDEVAREALERGLSQLRAIAARNDTTITDPGEADEAAVAELEQRLRTLAAREPGADEPGGDESAGTAEVEIKSGPRALRIAAERLERLTLLVGEAMVESYALGRHLEGELRRHQEEGQLLYQLQQIVTALDGPEARRLQHFRQRLEGYFRTRRRRRERLEQIQRRLTPVVEQMHREVLDIRMRPFSDIAAALPPLVASLAERLGKQAELVLQGEGTRIDREILERLAVPLKHLIQNALDHGVEPPEERRAAGKAETAVLRIHTRHRNGRLEIEVSDDGRGIDREALRRRALERRLVAPEVAAQLSGDDWLEFLFMPGFSTRDQVTELSGRGVGLDVVRDMVHSLNGELTVKSEPGRGTCFLLALPLTLAVMRVLLVEIAGEPYALPMVRVERLLKVSLGMFDIQGRHSLSLEDGEVSVLDGAQLLELESPASLGEETALVLVGDGQRRVGLRVDRWLGVREIALQSLDRGLGKIPHIFAASQLDDGTPFLVLDVDDLLRSAESSGPAPLEREGTGLRILVVDDSMTVRALLHQTLTEAGYAVDLAEDGVDAWSALHTRHYDLLLTDVDMPRMDGIELIRKLRAETRLAGLPVIVLSYKGREADRRRGLEAGADRYLAKSEFESALLLQAVGDLIGEPAEANQ